MKRKLHPRNKELIEQYIRACRLGRHGQTRVNTAKREGRIRCTLNVFTHDFFNNQPADEIGQEAVEDFFLKWKDGKCTYKTRHGSETVEKPYSVSTIKTNWKIFKKFYSFVNGWEPVEAPTWLRRLTIGDRDLPEVTPIDRNEYATKERLEMVCEYMRSPAKRMMLKTLFDWGIGYGEMTSVELSQVQYDPQRQRYFIDFPKGFKGARKARTLSYLFYEKDFVMWLRQHPDWDHEKQKPTDATAKLFPQLVVESFNKTLSRISLQLFGEKWTSHWMRRGFITHTSDEDVPESAIKYRAGLADNTEVLRHYSARSKKRDDLLHRSLVRSTTDKLEYQHASRIRELEEKLESTTEKLVQFTERQAKVDEFLDLLLRNEEVAEVLSGRLKERRVKDMLLSL